MMKKRNKLLFTILVLVVLSASSLLSALAQKNAYAGTLTTRISSSINTLNPFTWGTSSERYVIEHIYEALFRLNANNTVVPGLCSEWDVSSDYTVYNFTLRSNAYWHDSVAVTIDDVDYTFTKLYLDNSIPRRSWLFDEITDISVVTNSIIITFGYGVKPAEVLYEFATQYIVPEHIWTGIDIYSFYNLAPIGCGPFEFVSRTAGVEIELAKHTNYHFEGPCVIEKIIKIMPTQEVAFDALNTSFIDVLNGCNAAQTAYAKTDPDIEIHQVLQDYWMYLSPNQRRYPNNITEFRQAIFHGINRSEIIDVARNGVGAEMPASCCLPWGVIYDPSVTYYEYNTTLANLMLDELNFLDNVGSDGIREDDLGNPLEFELIVSADATESTATANIIESNMLDIGINVTVKPLIWDIVWQLIGGPGGSYPEKYDYDWCVVGWAGFWSDFHPNTFYWLLSAATWWGSDEVNIPGWNSSVRWLVTELCDDILYSTDSSLITTRLNQIQGLVADDLPYIPLNVLGSVNLYRIDEFEGWITGHVRGPDCWDSWLTVHLIEVPTVFEYINQAGIVALFVIVCAIITNSLLKKRKRK